MCVIIEKPIGVDFDEDDIANAYFNNSDGFGYMYAHGGRIISKKFVPKTTKEVQEVFNGLRDKYVAFHFRFTTHGVTTDAMSHPYPVLTKEKHGIDLYMMHNGIISDYGNAIDSDTLDFIRKELTPVLKDNPEWVEDKIFQSVLAEMIGGSKLLFMDGTGKVSKVNESLGDEFKGCWVSNTHSFSAGGRWYDDYQFGDKDAAYGSDVAYDKYWQSIGDRTISLVDFEAMTDYARIIWVEENPGDAVDMIMDLLDGYGQQFTKYYGGRE